MARQTGCSLRIIYRQTSGDGSLKSYQAAMHDISGRSYTTLLCRFVEADGLAERAAKELREVPVVDGKVKPWLMVQEKSVVHRCHCRCGCGCTDESQY